MRVVSGLVAMIALASCADDERPQHLVFSGSRLRAMYLVTAAGDRVFEGWFDTQLDERCEWTSGERPACLPPHLVATQYLDYECRTPVVSSFPPDVSCADDPRFLVINGGDCGPEIDQVWTLGSYVDSTGWYERDAAGCRRVTGEMTTFAVGGELVPVSTFLRGRVEQAGTGRIRTTTIVGDDGSSTPGNAYDAELGAPCSLSEERCRPAAVATTYTDDEACERPVMIARTDCPAPAYASTFSSDVVYRRGPVITSDPDEVFTIYGTGGVIVVDGDPACYPMQASVFPGDTLYASGAAVGPERFAPVVRLIGEGVEIRPAYLAALQHLQLDGYRDVARQVACDVHQVGPDEWRCLPSGGYVSEGYFYADDACTEPLTLVLMGDEDPPGTPAFQWTSDGCETTVRQRSLGVERPGPYYRREGDACTVFDTSWRGFEVGPEVPFDAPALTLMME